MTQPVDTEYYDLLGLKPNATEKEVTSAFRKLAIKWHPDKWTTGTDEEKQLSAEKYGKIQEAYEILSNPEKREIYNRHGKEGLEQMGGMGGMGGMSEEMLNEILQGMGGFGGFPFPGMGGRRGKPKEVEIKMPDLLTTVDLDMKQIYCGGKFEITVERMNIRNDVDADSKFCQKCTKCDGMGVVMIVKQMGPMIQQLQEKCRICKGTGIIVDEKLFIKETKSFTRSVPKGIRGGDKIVIDGEGHMIPKSMQKDAERTDIVVVVKENTQLTIDGLTYTRGDNFSLHIEMEIESHEALCGTVRTIRFLNDELINVKIPNCVVFQKPNDMVIIPKMGMPVYGQKSEYGDMYIILKIEPLVMTNDANNKLWEFISGTQMKEFLEKTLKKTNNKVIESQTVEQYKQSGEFNRNRHSSRDNDDHQQPSCAQQ